MGNLRVRALMGVSLMCVVIGAATFAFACTTQIEVRVDPPYGLSGSQARVTSRGYLPGEPVEIRWNSASGPVLGRATGDFSMIVTIPADARPGVSYIVAVANAGERDVTRGRPTVPFEVTTSPSQGPSAPGGTTSGNGSEAADPALAGRTSESATGGTQQSPAVGQPSGDLSFGAAPGSSSAAPSTDAAPSTGTANPAAPAPGPATAPAPALAPVGQPGAPAVGAPALVAQPAAAPAPQGTVSAPTRGSPAAVAGALETGSSVAAAPGTPAADLSAAPVGEEPVADAIAPQAQRAPGPQTAFADLWSGFGPEGSRIPSMIGPSGGSSSSVPGPGFGVGLLGVGLVGLAAGFGVAEARRRKVLVTSPASRG